MRLTGRITVCRMTFPGSPAVDVALGYPQGAYAGMDSLAAVANSIEYGLKHLAEAGEIDYADRLLRPPSPKDVEVSSLAVRVEPPRSAAERVPAATLSTPMLIWASGGGWIGNLPVFRIERWSRRREALADLLQEALALEMDRGDWWSDTANFWPLLMSPKLTIEHKDNVVVPVSALSARLRGQQAETKRLAAVATRRELHEGRGPSRCFGRDPLAARLLEAVSGPEPSNLLLVGPDGVGKSTLIDELCRLAPRTGLEIWETTAPRMLVALLDPSWEHPLNELVEDLAAVPRLLYLPDFAQLFEVGAYHGQEQTLGTALRGAIRDGKAHLVGECTPGALARLQQKAADILAAFEIVHVAAPPRDEQASIVARRMERERDAAAFAAEAIEEALALCHRYFIYSGFVGKVVTFLEDLRVARGPGDTTAVQRAEVIRHFCGQSGLPAFIVDADAPGPDPDGIRAHFNARVIGQPEAVDAVVEALCAIRARLVPTGKPIASFLFVGPTGVGKTELAKTLAGFMFGDRRRLLRFDMSEFADEGAVLRLIGAGEQSGLLTDAVQQQPFSVVLFDEIEKCDPSFFDLLLSILGEGRLSDARGTLVDFSACIVVMTSNLGGAEAQRGSPGFAGRERGAQPQQHYEEAVLRHFRPELVNRLDRIVAFSALDRAAMGRIVALEIEAIRAREAFSKRALRLVVDGEAIDHLASPLASDPFGARALQRHLHDAIVIPLARALRVAPVGFAVEVRVDVADGKLRFASAHSPPATARLPDGEQTRALDAAALFLRRLRAGPVMGQLHGELEGLRRRRRKAKGRRKGAAEDEARELALVECVEALDRLQAGADGLSIATISAHLDRTPPPAAADAWIAQAAGMKRMLSERMAPEAARITLGIYGPGAMLERPLELVRALCASHGWQIGVTFVGHTADPAKYVYGPDAAKMPESRPVCGVECRIAGAACATFFEREVGRHVWDFKGDLHTFAFWKVDRKTPPGVHRRNFADALPILRRYGLRGWFALRAKAPLEADDWIALLDRELTAQWNATLDAWLLGSDDG